MLTTHCHGILTFTPNSNPNTKPISKVVAFRSIIQAPATVAPSISIANRKWKKRLRWRRNGIRKDRDETPSYAQDQECPVPLAQQPLNEYQTLTKSDFFSWALEDFWKYGLRLAGICTAFTTLIGWPVARVSVNPEQELLKCGIGALGGGLLIVTLVALHEETGWYDGEVWVKPPEVLARDRLLGSYTVRMLQFCREHIGFFAIHTLRSKSTKEENLREKQESGFRVLQ
eukprot:TRINITY_DN25529_c0_g1_i3.p1 TRINITY_DN25529_c0_g1~~TRINITY_DN25529_c0_g1_i3.p1  ORF type:complete len:229 (+),score=25.08 TRINITY_DN25529_c0_g1_i3:236-922(+)